MYFFLSFHEFMKIKRKSFECPKFIRNYEKDDTWNIRCLVDESFVPITQQTSVLYCRLSDFKKPGKIQNYFLQPHCITIVRPWNLFPFESWRKREVRAELEKKGGQRKKKDLELLVVM